MIPTPSTWYRSYLCHQLYCLVSKVAHEQHHAGLQQLQARRVPLTPRVMHVAHHHLQATEFPTGGGGEGREGFKQPWCCCSTSTAVMLA